jgi:putative ABC transport system permease protein
MRASDRSSESKPETSRGSSPSTLTILRPALLPEILAMAQDSLVNNKLRSTLMIVGIVIGVSTLVGMTALIRGFDQSLRALLKEMGPDTIFVMKLSGVSILEGNDITELLKRPDLTLSEANSIATQVASVRSVDVWLGSNTIQRHERLTYGRHETTPMLVMGASGSFSEVSFASLATGRFFTDSEVRRRRHVVVLGQGPFRSLFPDEDPTGKRVRIAGEEYTVVGTLQQRPNPAGMELPMDDIVVIPFTRYEAKYGISYSDNGQRDLMIVAAPRSPELHAQALLEIEEIMRTRHGLKVDEANDFDLVTQDTALKIWDGLTQVTWIALIIISSISLTVGGIGVMAVMTMAVTERTREIGVRKAVGARKREILWQFLAEAGLLTSTGGVLGVIVGTGLGLIVHFAFDFPISLPWWSYALGLGISTGVGVAFGTVPAVRAAAVNPIDALHYE